MTSLLAAPSSARALTPPGRESTGIFEDGGLSVRVIAGRMPDLPLGHSQ